MKIIVCENSRELGKKAAQTAAEYLTGLITEKGVVDKATLTSGALANWIRQSNNSA